VATPSISVISALPRMLSTSGGNVSVSIETATSGFARSARTR
jgi:hypothetical protein